MRYLKAHIICIRLIKVDWFTSSSFIQKYRLQINISMNVVESYLLVKVKDPRTLDQIFSGDTASFLTFTRVPFKVKDLHEPKTSW